MTISARSMRGERRPCLRTTNHMSSWSKRRRLTYLTVIIVVLVGAIIVPGFFIFYRAPTCFDGIKNGNEQGIDCGGGCQRLCPSAFLPPSVAWARFENVAPSLYNVGAYVVNPNIDGEAMDVPYHAALYDAQGGFITEFTGTVTLPPHRNTLAFKGSVNVGKRIPAKALFEFSGIPDWHKRADPLAALVIGDKDYAEDDSGSSLAVTIKNASVHAIDNVGVSVVLYDKDGNAIGFSHTTIDEIPGSGQATAPFTWPENRHGAVISIEVLPVAE